ncbi:MAG: NmrA family NAD(P)-binding protein [Armatimonadetes bacterium]|nr:NmrA family NAD(P)-binding protein [Armatimonadota bacterium]
MNEFNGTILSVGAAGHFAGLVVPELAKRGVTVRALIRDVEQTDAVLQKGATEVAIGDLSDRASIDAALNGVDSVFYIAPVSISNEAEIGVAMVAAAKQAGVRRFVFSSLIHPALSALPNHIAKAPVEEAILASDMEFVLLHPSMFFQNIAEGWQETIKTGVYTEPWSSDSRFSRVDYRDVAEVAAIALTENRLTWGTFELCAEGHLSRKEMARLMSEVLGTNIEPGTVAPKKLAPSSENSEEAREMASLQPMIDWYDKHGLVGNALILRAILGREPRTLRDYLAELAAKS